MPSVATCVGRRQKEMPEGKASHDKPISLGAAYVRRGCETIDRYTLTWNHVHEETVFSITTPLAI